mmetsp:Transcript_16779/g.26169  ORF Transcript_16779/g.26169 Transcript_16779/m.26169 type:complete len:84 (+) Transcript_16779:166-417(+)
MDPPRTTKPPLDPRLRRPRCPTGIWRGCRMAHSRIWHVALCAEGSNVAYGIAGWTSEAGIYTKVYCYAVEDGDGAEDEEYFAL